MTKEIDNKIETLENKFKVLVKVIEEKDSLLIELEKKVKDTDTNAQKVIQETELKFKSLEEKMQTLQKENEVIQDKLNNIESHVNSVETKHKCEKCKFTTSSEQGLKTHISKKHKAGKKKEETLTFPITC